MVHVTFITHDGRQTTVETAEGDSVMRAALAHDIAGITGECGGAMMCATCHCYVDDAWAGRVGAREDGEEDMLDSASCTITPTSRLSCQIRLTAALDGLVVHLPERQL